MILDRNFVDTVDHLLSRSMIIMNELEYIDRKYKCAKKCMIIYKYVKLVKENMHG